MPATHPSPLPTRQLFQSYAHTDFTLAQSLMRRLRQQLDACTTLRCDVWSDRQILIGADWHRTIKDALARSDAGLLLLSPAALASGYIRKTEIPALQAKQKLLLVGLRPFDFATQLPPALQAAQIFRLQTASGALHCYSECSTTKQKDAFALDLYHALCARLV